MVEESSHSEAEIAARSLIDVEIALLQDKTLAEISLKAMAAAE
jgi:hypothetical protein